MKKILLLGFFPLFICNLFAQDAADKDFQAGLVVGMGMNFQKMETKLIDKNALGFDRFIGGNFIKMFNETIGLLSGIEFDFSTARFMTGNKQVYYYYTDSKILSVSDADQAKNIFRLSERRQTATYLTVPTVLVFRTNYVGYIRYFGKFGMRHGFLLGQKSNDMGETTQKVNGFSTTETYARVEQKDMKSSNEMFFYKGSIGISGGLDWNFMGTTSLLVEIGYNYGITPLFYQRKNPFLYTFDEDNVQVNFSNKAKQGSLHLKVSLLF